MKCPYCQKAMIEGVIKGDRYRLKWKSKEKNDKSSILKKPRMVIPVEYDHHGIKAFYCPEDEVFIFNKIGG